MDSKELKARMKKVALAVISLVEGFPKTKAADIIGLTIPNSQ